jgi:hypothetical protein
LLGGIDFIAGPSKAPGTWRFDRPVTKPQG